MNIGVSLENYADRIIAIQNKMESLHAEQKNLVRGLGAIHWPDGWTGKDGRRLPDPLSRFVNSIEMDHESECWNWNGNITNSGYGLFAFDAGCVLAHRFSMKMTKGLKGSPLVVDHLCSNRKCVNPAHWKK